MLKQLFHVYVNRHVLWWNTLQEIKVQVPLYRISVDDELLLLNIWPTLNFFFETKLVIEVYLDFMRLTIDLEFNAFYMVPQVLRKPSLCLCMSLLVSKPRAINALEYTVKLSLIYFGADRFKC